MVKVRRINLEDVDVKEDVREKREDTLSLDEALEEEKPREKAKPKSEEQSAEEAPEKKLSITSESERLMDEAQEMEDRLEDIIATGDNILTKSIEHAMQKSADTVQSLAHDISRHVQAYKTIMGAILSLLSPEHMVGFETERGVLYRVRSTGALRLLSFLGCKLIMEDIERVELDKQGNFSYAISGKVVLPNGDERPVYAEFDTLQPFFARGIFARERSIDKESGQAVYTYDPSRIPPSIILSAAQSAFARNALRILGLQEITDHDLMRAGYTREQIEKFRNRVRMTSRYEKKQ